METKNLTRIAGCAASLSLLLGALLVGHGTRVAAYAPSFLLEGERSVAAPFSSAGAATSTCLTDLCSSIWCARSAPRLNIGHNRIILATCIDRPGDEDYITFTADPSRNYDFRASSRSEVKVQMAIYGPLGYRFAVADENKDPTTHDARILSWTPPWAGTFVLKLSGWDRTYGSLTLMHDYDENRDH